MRAWPGLRRQCLPGITGSRAVRLGSCLEIHVTTCFIPRLRTVQITSDAFETSTSHAYSSGQIFIQPGLINLAQNLSIGPNTIGKEAIIFSFIHVSLLDTGACERDDVFFTEAHAIDSRERPPPSIPSFARVGIEIAIED